MKKLVISAILISLASGSFAEKDPGYHAPVVTNPDNRAAGCAPANERLFTTFNNVRALVETGGSMWQDRTLGSNGRASYEIPKGEGKHVLYAGALWMGGEDINGQLKLAAHTYRQGNDFWPGPLGQLIQGSGNFNPFVVQNADLVLVRDNGAADIIPSQCTKYDNFFTIRKNEVKQFILWWQCENGVLLPADCEEVITPSSEVINRIVNWPAHGDPAQGEDFYLAPFYDNIPVGQLTGNGRYDPIIDGDYPWYDINEEIDCRNDRRVTLFGDETNWWVFNDKGNIHTETGGDPIGMEIRAQAFAFATDDAINDMTFYNYELINRGTQTLYNTYFGQWADPDVGLGSDDYVGCDVTRGLGYAYNGVSTDPGAVGQTGYGSNPPAVGIDFFEGPYQDNDGIDNAKGILPGQALNGIGYGDAVADNERFGMRRFVYYNIGGAQNGDPTSATDHYRYMKGIWKNGASMFYGGDGFNSGTTTLECNFMFPGESDPLHWGTNGVDPSFDWTEIQAGNPPGDRRFIQAAGPFTLTPGAVNNITVGVVYGRSTETDLEASVRAMKTADSKAQALFDNCFQLVEPPVAPVLTIQEMENQLILYLQEPPGFDEQTWFERDRINIITPDDLAIQGIFYDDTFKFEGYQIYQMRDEFASVSELSNLDKARLVAQCDVENGVSKLVNYTFDEQLEISIPAVMVDGADKGLRHSFLITEDLFATGNRTLVNHKKYHYLAVAYAYNQFKEYDPTDPLLLDGQKNPYLRSRISGLTGQGIESVVGIPHDPSPEADGTIFTTTYGYQPEITQIEGLGNGGNFLELTDATVDEIMASAAGKVNHPIYKSGSGPVDITVVDPLNLKAGVYTLLFDNSVAKVNDGGWRIERYDAVTNTTEIVYSDYLVSISNEQLILEWGISVRVTQKFYVGTSGNSYTSPIDATITYEDSSKQWLWGIPDGDGYYSNNWIRSGTADENATDNPECVGTAWIYNPCYYNDKKPNIDLESEYEKLLGGIIAPFNRVGYEAYGMPFGRPGYNYSTETGGWFASGPVAQSKSSFLELHDVDIIITDDKSKWTRCPVIEINDNETQTEHGDDVLAPRQDNSVDKDGNDDGTGKGMGWFPGYAIDVNTGARLNMAFAENSWLAGENGRDMIWNPTSSFADNVGNPLLGGMHYVYVFGENVDGSGCPNYDGGNWLMSKWDMSVSASARNANYFAAWKNCMWVFEPFLVPNSELLETDVKISARINKPYEKRAVTGENNTRPMYQFTITDPTIKMNHDQLVSVLDNINVVPNPYYAYSSYETSKLDSRVKITNLPERCTITIFNMQGALVRSFEKDDPLTSLDWDLKNFKNIPIAGGVYLIHIKVDLWDVPPIETPLGTTPGIGLTTHERIIKWYGVLRQPDLDNL